MFFIGLIYLGFEVFAVAIIYKKFFWDSVPCSSKSSPTFRRNVLLSSSGLKGKQGRRHITRINSCGSEEFRVAKCFELGVKDWGSNFLTSLEPCSLKLVDVEESNQ
jgi:hypothetical protein